MDTSGNNNPTRLFAYCRVSAAEQTTDNQVQEIINAGFALEPHRIITETVSGSIATRERNGFTKLLEKLEKDDVLVGTKLDRLGRNAMEVRGTVEKLASMGVRVQWLQLGGVDLTSSAGKMTMQVINAVAEFERDLLIERTQSGLQRAKAEGKTLGRPQLLTKEQREQIARKLKEGVSVSQLSREFRVSRQSVSRCTQAA